MGEFEQAERDDWELEKAQDKVDREHDRNYLYDFDTRVEDWEAAWRADKRRQAEANRRLLEGGDTALLRAQVAELLKLARDLDYDIWTLCGTGTYEMREDLRDERYPSVTEEP